VANFRSIHTKMWSDRHFEALSPYAKLIFAYLLTNPHRTPSGLYQITTRRIGVETSMNNGEVEGGLAELIKAELVLYCDDTATVFIINAVKYLQNTKQMRLSIVKDVLYNNSPLSEKLLIKHNIRSWAEWGDDEELALAQREAEGLEEDG